MTETVSKVTINEPGLIDVLKREKAAGGYRSFVRTAEVLIREAAESRAITRAKDDAFVSGFVARDKNEAS